MENKKYGFARCSTKKQDVAYEIKSLVDQGVPRENIFIAIDKWKVI